MTRKPSVPKLDGLNIKIMDDRAYVYLADELIWAGSITEWAYALANPIE